MSDWPEKVLEMISHLKTLMASCWLADFDLIQTMKRLVTKVGNLEVSHQLGASNQNFANCRNFPIATASMIGSGCFHLTWLTNHDIGSVGKHIGETRISNGLEREDMRKNKLFFWALPDEIGGVSAHTQIFWSFFPRMVLKMLTTHNPGNPGMWW